MIDETLQILQNGSDIRGVATCGIIGESITLTTEKVGRIGLGFYLWLRKRKQLDRRLRIAIGMDGRLMGPDFANALQDSISHAGADVLYCGMASTPAMLQSTIISHIGADGAIMVTGSHMSFNRNGLKFFFDGVEADSSQLSEIIVFASEAEKHFVHDEGEIHITNLMAEYCHILREKICNGLKSIVPNPLRPLEGFKIVVDAGNGAGGFFVKRVLDPLGADTQGSQFLNPDGRFPNHSPNPEDYEAMRAIVSAVNYSHADLGIIFDSDVDRVAIVDEDGRVINRNEFVAMATAIVLEEHPHTSVVTDSITSNGLGVFIRDILGAHQCRYQRGYRNVINEAIRKNEAGNPCWLAAETSGHSAFKENHFVDDGAYFATKVIIRLVQLRYEGKKLFSLIESLPVPIESREYRLTILDDDFTRAATDTLEGLRQYVSQMEGWETVTQNHEGLRVICNGADEQGWFLFRLSLHTPVMPLNIESDVRNGVNSIVLKLKRFFRNVKAIDSVQLYN